MKSAIQELRESKQYGLPGQYVLTVHKDKYNMLEKYNIPFKAFENKFTGLDLFGDGSLQIVLCFVDKEIRLYRSDTYEEVTSESR